MNRVELVKNQLSSVGHSKNLLKIFNALPNNNSVKVVKMDSPPMNVLGKDLAAQIVDTLLKLNSDEETKIIILTGNEKVFAAGADIKHFSKQTFVDMINDDYLSILEDLYYKVDKPIIAAINGYAFGGGFELALCCDIIIASDKAKLGFPELKLGLFPGAGGTQRITKLVGYHKAAEYVFTAKDIDLNELKQMGVVNKVVSSDKVMESAIETAKDISKFSMVSLKQAKKAIRMSLETNLYPGLKAEKYLFQGIFNSEDKKIGIDAFINKKEAKFVDK
jgi:enoyl-CoA hydratase/carnithine racemase